MSDGKERKIRGYLEAILHQNCPRCREGNMFIDKNPYHLKELFNMYAHCPVCAQRMELEPGFYYGTAYVSYALTVAFSVATFVACWVLIGFSVEDNRIFWWLAINGLAMVLLQPYLIRVSRTVWLSFFVKYDIYWKQGKKVAE
jgi:hypothetical protein